MRLCRGGPIKIKLKAGHTNLVTDDWLFMNCVPHIRLRFPNDCRLCWILGLSTLYAYCDLTLRATLPEAQRIRLEAALQGVDYGVNAVEKTPLHVCSVNGNLCIDEMSLLLVLLLMVQFYRASCSISSAPSVPRPLCRCKLTTGLLP